MTRLALERLGLSWRLQLRGSWSLAAMAAVEDELKNLPAVFDGPVVCDWSGAESPGIGPAWALLHRLAERNPGGHAITHTGAPYLLDFLHTLHDERHPLDGPRPEPGTEGVLGALGRWTLTQGIEARGAVGFYGRIVMVLREAFTRPGALRVPSLVRHIYETGITAIPIVSLIAFLISVIVAYLGAQQLSRFGANIFVVDLVTISVLREMGVLLTAIIVAGLCGALIGIPHLAPSDLEDEGAGRDLFRGAEHGPRGVVRDHANVDRGRREPCVQ